jgi:nucleotide-binding universal stress UspA family protein
MATHADQGLWRWARGSVVDQLIHTTTIPMLLVRGLAHATPPAPTLKRILVPFDGSALAQQALPLAIKLAALARAELILLQVTAPSIEAYLRDYPVSAELKRALHDQVRQAFNMFAGDVDPRSMRLTTAIALGLSAEAIAEEAARRQIDLLVMATHGYTGLQRWRLGSVAAELLYATTTPMLLVRSHIADSEIGSG